MCFREDFKDDVKEDFNEDSNKDPGFFNISRKTFT